VHIGGSPDCLNPAGNHIWAAITPDSKPEIKNPPHRRREIENIRRNALKCCNGRNATRPRLFLDSFPSPYYWLIQPKIKMRVHVSRHY
jgi:hypothetical protein